MNASRFRQNKSKSRTSTGCSSGAGLMVGAFNKIKIIDMKDEISLKLTKSFYSCKSDCTDPFSTRGE